MCVGVNIKNDAFNVDLNLSFTVFFSFGFHVDIVQRIVCSITTETEIKTEINVVVSALLEFDTIVPKSNNFDVLENAKKPSLMIKKQFD